VREPQRLGQRPALDGLRGIAVLLVVVMHADGRLLPGGYIGVDMFFVLSGFLITALLLDEWSATARLSLHGFYLRRIRRLGPAFAVLLLAGALLSGRMAPHGSTPYALATLGAVFEVNNWLLVYGHAHLGVLTPTWSLAIEEQFYLLWPAILTLLLRHRVDARRLAAALVAATTVSVAATLTLAATFPHGNLYNSSIPHAGELTAGCLAAVLWRERRTPRWLIGPTAVATAVALLVFLAIRTHIATADPAGCLLAAAAAMVLVLRLVAGPPCLLHRLLEGRLLTRTGRISYAMYLYNLPIIVLITGKLLHTTTPIVLLTARLAAVYLAAAASWYLVETPIRHHRQPLPAGDGSGNNRASIAHRTDPALVTIGSAYPPTHKSSWIILASDRAMPSRAPPTANERIPQQQSLSDDALITMTGALSPAGDAAPQGC
jgi:peptidoglycan/LPS O-acetylase OafA/YrhL